VTEFLTLTFIGLLMIISPGPDFAIVTKTSLGEGRLAGFMAAIGIAMANLCHVGVNLLGIGVIISKSVIAFTILKVLGAAYLLYIGYKGLRAKPLNTREMEVRLQANVAGAQLQVATDTQTSTTLPISLRQLGKQGFFSGFLTSLLNPKACLFYLSFFSVILSAGTPLATQAFYGIWLSSLAMGWFLLVAFFFTNPAIAVRLKKGKHWLERFTGGVLMFLGLRLLSSEATL
jgi:threonine/homoserine/homoserine lactone efflux protein